MSQYYQRALRQMDLDRSDKIARAEENRRAFYAAHPELDDLESQIAAVTREAFRSLRGTHPVSGEEAAAAAQKKIDVLRREHEARVRAAGGDPNDFLPRWDCPACRDMGYIDTPDGNRRMCDCLKAKAASMAITHEEFRPDAGQNFDAFDLSRFPETPDPVPGERNSQRKLMALACQIAREYAGSFSQKGSGNFLLCGASGLGKTYLLQCVANAVAERGYSVCYLTAYRLSNLLRDAYLGEDEAAHTEQALINCDLLCIDDLGSEPIRRNINLESLFSILNERTIAHRATAVASNLLLTQLRDRYGERITSRLAGENCRTIRLYGADLRLAKNIREP